MGSKDVGSTACAWNATGCGTEGCTPASPSLLPGRIRLELASLRTLAADATLDGAIGVARCARVLETVLRAHAELLGREAVHAMNEINTAKRR